MARQKSTKLPEFLKPYFWDVEFNDIDVEKSKHFIVKRAIDRGNTSAVKFVIKTYGLDAIREVVLTTRDISRPTGNFWADMLNLDKKQVPCLQKPYEPLPIICPNKPPCMWHRAGLTSRT